MNRMSCAIVMLLWTAQLHGQLPAEDVLGKSGIRGGLVVVVGLEDPDCLIEFQPDGKSSYLVHGLDTRPDRVSAARTALNAHGLSGPVSAARFDGQHLPYVDNLVNLLVLQTPVPNLTASEIERALAPGGVAMVNGEKTSKRIPEGLDEWTHHMYDATGIGAGKDTMVSQPRSIQWKAGPEYSRSHENMSSVSAVVSSGGRVFSIVDEGPTASIYLPSKWFLTARDAFSGVQLWKIPIEQWHARLFPLKSGPLQLPRRLVATPERVYVTLGIDAPVSELDAATGEELQTLAGTEHAEELLWQNGRLLVVVNTDSATLPYRGRTPDSRRTSPIDEQALNLGGERSIVMVETITGNTIWKSPPSNVIPLTIAADQQHAYFVRGNQLVAIRLGNGKEVWTETVAAKKVRYGTASSPTLLVHDNVVYLAMQGTLNAHDASTGKALWSAECAVAGYRAPASVFVVNGLIWDVDAGGEPYRPGTDRSIVNRRYTGYDLRTGEVVKTIPVTGEHGYAIMHHRCHIPRASGNCIITSFPGIEFFDVESGESTHDSWLRGACLYGFMPANGLIYTPPHPCACYTQGKLTGFWAVAGERVRPAPVTSSHRLEEGPAFEKHSPPVADSDKARDNWPTYRADNVRRGTTAVHLPSELKTVWNARVGANLSQCVIANGRLFVTTREDHTVHALDANNGKPLWRFIAGGRVDSAPTWHDGKVFFGCRDGYVYCLSANTGQLVWRFLAAPIDERCVVYDQVESVWPVHGSVLIIDGVLWCCAGRSSFLDGGMVVYRLDAGTGKRLSTTTLDSLGKDDEQPPITPTIFARLEMEGAKNDVMSCDGSRVFMRHWAFDMEGNNAQQDVDHLFSPTGFLDTSWFRRTYWIYGRSYVSGAQGWARTGNVRPSGRILSIDDDRLYGFGRDYYPPSPGNRHQMYSAGESERLFALAKSSSSVSLDSEKASPRRRPPQPEQNLLWSTPADLQIRAMVLTGVANQRHLFIAGSKGDWIISPDAYEGKQGNLLRTVSVEDGSVLAEVRLRSQPVFDGMSVADGKLYLSLEDGTVTCFGGG